MDKIKGCRICGRIDFKEDGIHMVCRACGEKRPMYPFPRKQFLLFLLFMICGILSTILAFTITYLSPTGSNSPQRPWFSVLTGGAFNAGDSNGFDFFMRGIENYLIIIIPLTCISAIVFYVLMVIYAKSFFSYMKKKQQAEDSILKNYK